MGQINISKEGAAYLTAMHISAAAAATCLALGYISRFGRFDVSGMEREGEERSFAVTAHITHAAAATWRTTGKSVSGDTFGQERSGEGE